MLSYKVLFLLFLYFFPESEDESDSEDDDFEGIVKGIIYSPTQFPQIQWGNWMCLKMLCSNF